jgi:hypothetical protein
LSEAMETGDNDTIDPSGNERLTVTLEMRVAGAASRVSVTESGKGDASAGLLVKRTETRVCEKVSSYAALLSGRCGNGDGVRGGGTSGRGDDEIGWEIGASDPSSGSIAGSMTLRTICRSVEVGMGSKPTYSITST